MVAASVSTPPGKPVASLVRRGVRELAASVSTPPGKPVASFDSRGSVGSCEREHSTGQAGGISGIEGMFA